MTGKDGKYIFGVVKVGEKEQIVIPKDVRKYSILKPEIAYWYWGIKNRDLH